jgi:alkanesulfonate monooxygenase
VWALTNGAWGSRHHPDEPPDASWARNKRQLLLAEELGFDSTLLAQHTINPAGDTLGHLEVWTASAALAEITRRIEIIAAIKPFLYHPAVLAKQALQIDEISGGRFSLNVVNGWFVPEMERTGLSGTLDIHDHDERYGYGKEWLTIVRRLLVGERTSFEGKHFHVHDLQLRPQNVQPRGPRIYIGGESPAARSLAADLGDVWFINGQPFDDVRGLIEDVRRRPRTGGPLDYALSAYVIARPTAAEAQDELDEAFRLAGLDTERRSFTLGNVGAGVQMFKTFAKNPAVGTNGGTAAGLVGDYDTVAKRILEFHEAGIETFMLQFQPADAEARRFAEHVIPRVRRLAKV